MSEIRFYIKKYFLVVIAIFVLRFLIHELFPELFIRTIEGDGFTQSKTTIFGMYNFYFYNLILSIFVFLDLRKLSLEKMFIPILTITSMGAGLFFFAFMVINKLIDIDYGK